MSAKYDIICIGFRRFQSFLIEKLLDVNHATKSDAMATIPTIIATLFSIVVKIDLDNQKDA